MGNPGQQRPENVSQAGTGPIRSSILERPVQFLRGVGPHRAKILAEMGIQTVADLVMYFPFRFEEQPRPQTIESLRLDEPATVIGRVESVKSRRGCGRFGPSVLNVILRDGTGRMRVTWFNADYLSDRIQRGQVLRVFGKVGVEGDLGQLTNPKVEWLDSDDDPADWDFGRLVPIYRACGHLASGQIARIVASVLDEAVAVISEPLPAWLLRRRELPSRGTAITAMHRPQTLEEIAPARRRLAYEELLLMQLAVTLRRGWAARNLQAPPLPTSEKVNLRIRRRFPFALTESQNRVIREIVADLARTRPMTRLLQGDVGSGKTVVALYAALVTVANHRQCAILAPTEVLASQHHASIEKYLAGSRVRRCLLTGRTAKAARRQALDAIARGEMDLVVGTQALLETTICFPSLGLVIVDEQHKFGVIQRATLKNTPLAGETTGPPAVPHYLVMTATPIPRTLSMTVFGDLDVSVIDKLPPGRQPITTRMITPRQEPDAWSAVRRRIASGDQAYVVYPLVEESDALDLKAATAEVDRVAHELLPGTRVGLLHGRMKKHEKATVMQDFIEHRLDVLVSTTVIEVGVDVPNATIMVVQHAERYGLSALHQLRGRVGRGSKPSACLLMSEGRGGLAARRLKVLCQTTDGFKIAEEDLALRGPGELLGTRQHGFPEFLVANLVEDVDLLMKARDDAARIVREDAGLRRPHHVVLKAELRRKFRDKIALIDVG
ncbi:MAG TPA: ATP-dependent DNA helicase RecG [Phycisphaerae bacterium]|nr:ATP-dependent DNA helicase RecG [Phycisphaerae bacterium]